ncbi:hypothetical protein TRFO_25428 [Tritrichomonas foetus]|uniref:5'-3' DNA helicase ZGRF1-like N-terminal domain-containing protein n=1 Tax=Tritrichomonas foetus TaxID=1144522 RepID=A0A1J4KA20_9EUKA|nr:hypothetical protein TRFO_25428 [Tritrichomonas foetus]|eukprot:OHT06540.1 hypothetical protein TRFO_25428 [Tritrichomonas foetus]
MGRYACLYTQRISQRQKQFKDGFVVITQAGNGLYNILLYDEENIKIASLKTFDSPPLDGSNFQVSSYLLQIDSPEDRSPPSPPQVEFAHPLATSHNEDHVNSTKPTKIQNKCNNKLQRNKFEKSLPSKELINNTLSNLNKKVHIETNNVNSIKQISREYERNLRAEPREFDEIIEFFKVSKYEDPTGNFVQKNLKEYV